MTNEELQGQIEQIETSIRQQELAINTFASHQRETGEDCASKIYRRKVELKRLYHEINFLKDLFNNKALASKTTVEVDALREEIRQQFVREFTKENQMANLWRECQFFSTTRY